jgi:tubulin-specific chaperone D
MSRHATTRPASAAFQENVGRQGHQNFPFGIEILTAADYFTLGNRQAAYQDIALAVARFPPYRHPLIDHLTQVKLRHWDPAIRALASQALARLTALAPAHMLEVVCPSLLGQVDAVDLNRCVRACVRACVHACTYIPAVDG